MRVLHYIPTFWVGGIEQLFLQWYSISQRSGDVELELLTNAGGPPSAALESYLRMGGTVHRIPPPSLRDYLRHRSGVRRFFREHHDYDILHAHGVSDRDAFCYAKKYGVKAVVFHVHSMKKTDGGIQDAIRGGYESMAQRFVDVRLACSAQAARSQFGDRDALVLNNAIPTADYCFSGEIRAQVREELGLDGETVALGHVGRMVTDKNYDFLIRVFQAVCARTDSARLFLVGDGPERNAVSQAAAAAGLADRTVFLGIRSDVHRLLQGFDGLVFPSVREGFGIVALESQAASLPCVLSDAVPPEVVFCDCAVRLPCVDPDRWAQTLLRMIRQPRTDTSARIVEAGYDMETQTRRLFRLYREIAHGTE